MNLIINFNPTTILIIIFIIIFIVQAIVIYKSLIKCPPNKVLIIYGKLDTTSKPYRIIKSGSALVLPIIQEHKFLDLKPFKVPIELSGALDKNNNRINLSCVFIVQISTEPNVLDNAIERLLGISEGEITDLIGDITIGQMRNVISQIEEQDITSDYERFFHELKEHINPELNKIGIQINNASLSGNNKTIR